MVVMEVKLVWTGIQSLLYFLTLNCPKLYRYLTDLNQFWPIFYRLGTCKLMKMVVLHMCDRTTISLEMLHEEIV